MKKMNIIRAVAASLLIVGASTSPMVTNVAEASILDTLGRVLESIDKISSSVTKKTEKQLTEADKLLFYALRNDDWELAKQALQEGADVNAYDKSIGLPIDQVMLSTGNYEIIDWLIQNGADPEGWCEYDNNRKKVTHYYIFRSHATKIPFWIEHGVSPNIKDSRGITPVYAVLNVAGDKGSTAEQLEAVKYLVEHGADINHKTPNGFYNIHTGGSENETPLMWAAREGWIDFVQYLLEAGADPNIRGGQGNKETALDMAMRNNRQGCVKLLLQYTKRG